MSAQFGIGVSGAGDVNGDGYADVIVGAYGYDAGESNDGAAFVFLGSASGIANGNPTTASAQLASNQAGGLMGFSVSGAGDVNGDGYADVIVGAYLYDCGDVDDGAAFVFLGNSEGRSVLAQQRRDDGSAIAVQPWGGSNDADSFEVAVTATHPQGRGRVKLEVEVCPPAVPFEDGSCTAQIGSSWTDVTATPDGVVLSESISPAASGLLYRWRARVLHAPFSVTEPGIGDPANPAHSPWRRLSGQAQEADVRVIPEPGLLFGQASALAILALLTRRAAAAQTARVVAPRLGCDCE